ncbi:unnamed protein product [Hymenolepis diminuta]|uniref:Alpha-carbonic anhydrase domain-containing protein n=1 Tax=Hymenolepis diminuta TaxID=6216 RepID=A0A0R3SNH5_HYMDI|nr:unnamed protein product [Hymenolepis diminuta]
MWPKSQLKYCEMEQVALKDDFDPQFDHSPFDNMIDGSTLNAKCNLRSNKISQPWEPCGMLGYPNNQYNIARVQRIRFDP